MIDDVRMVSQTAESSLARIALTPTRNYLFAATPPHIKYLQCQSVPHYTICYHSSTQHDMLYLVGLGLADETDITVKGLEIVKKVERVYLEAYTSILLVDTPKLV